MINHYLTEGKYFVFGLGLCRYPTFKVIRQYPGSRRG